MSSSKGDAEIALADLEDHLKSVREEFEKSFEKMSILSLRSNDVYSTLQESLDEQNRLRERISLLENQLRVSADHISSLDCCISDRDNTISNLNTDILDLNGVQISLKNQLDEYNASEKELKSIIAEKISDITALTEEVSARKKAESVLESQFNKSTTANDQLHQEISTQDKAMRRLKEELGQSKGRVGTLESRVANYEAQVDVLKTKLAEADSETASLNNKLMEASVENGFLESRISTLQAELEERDESIAGITVDLIDAKMMAANKSELADAESKRVAQLTRALEAAASTQSMGDGDTFESPPPPPGEKQSKGSMRILSSALHSMDKLKLPKSSHNK